MTNKYLEVLKGEFTIHRFNASDKIPYEVYKSKFYWIGKTDEELSIVCKSNLLNNKNNSASNWTIIRIAAKLDFSVVGVLAEISNALKDAGVSVIALSTYDTDYIMLKTAKLNEAKIVLENIGYEFI